MDAVTGATGLLGNALVRELELRGKKVRAIVRPTSKIACLNSCGAEIVYGDVLDYKSLITAFYGIETVYHLASEVSIMPGSNKKLQEINLKGTENVINACLETGVKKLVYTSSIHAFKEQNGSRIVDESLSFDPESSMGLYNRTKAQASIYVAQAAKKGLDTYILCPTAIIGPYDFKVSNLGSMFIQYCNRRQKIIIDGAYDFVDVRDVAAGHILAAEKGKPGEAYILSGHRLTINELMKQLETITGITAPKFKFPYWLAMAVAFVSPVYYKLSGSKPVFTVFSLKTVKSNSFISHEKASSQLGYCPRPIRQTLEENIKWFKDNDYL